jgi:hypothetical protein
MWDFATNPFSRTTRIIKGLLVHGLPVSIAGCDVGKIPLALQLWSLEGPRALLESGIGTALFCLAATFSGINKHFCLIST